jgi:uncharacterized protein YjbI with pentapeptide repeats
VTDPRAAATDRSADCSRCIGLCCVAPAFSRSADFALDKPAGRPCPKLGLDHRCTIHERLRASGFSGCVAYDCFGAGQRVTEGPGAGLDWRRSAAEGLRLFEVFHAMRGLHELRWHLEEALTVDVGDDGLASRAALEAAAAEVEGAACGSVEALLALDVQPLRQRVSALLQRYSAARRGPVPGPDRSRASLLGARLRRADLRGASLFAACLVGADLRGADLRGADLRGADLRGADLAGADLRGALFLTQSQLESARGDRATRLPEARRPPAAWLGPEAR